MGGLREEGCRHREKASLVATVLPEERAPGAGGQAGRREEGPVWVLGRGRFGVRN